MPDVFLTVDLEPDCPPYLRGWRGMETGAPPLLDLLGSLGVPATFFTTGEAAQRHPDVVEALVGQGHELGCHGHTHRAFPDLDRQEAAREVERSSEILRSFAPVTAFRAPFLRLPDRFLPLLEEAGYEIEASRSRYTPAHWLQGEATTLVRLPASTTSSVLRLPAWVRDPFLAQLSSPVVLFVHPWEFVDMTAEPIPWHCRLGTGPSALQALEAVVTLFSGRGARFRRMGEAARSRAPAPTTLRPGPPSDSDP